MELPEKIEAVLVSYLRARVQAALDAETLPAYFVATPDPDADPPIVSQIQPGESDQDITAQLLRVIAGDADQEHPQFTGNFQVPVMVELLTPIAEQTADQEASADPAVSTSQLDKHRVLAALLEKGIMVDTLHTELNAAALALGAGYEFTAFGILDRLPQRGQTANLYQSGYTFRLYCCGRTL